MVAILEHTFPESLPGYASVSIAYEVASVFDVSGEGPFVLTERYLSTPYLKDYDKVAGDAPAEWGRRFDISRWTFFLARRGGETVGAAAIAFDTPAVEMLEGRRDLAQVWDLRVAPTARGAGVGRALWRQAEDWARTRGCRTLKVETQNVNVPACRFYERMGCALRAVHRRAYPDLPHEIQLLWYKDLAKGAAQP